MVGPPDRPPVSMNLDSNQARFHESSRGWQEVRRRNILQLSHAIWYIPAVDADRGRGSKCEDWGNTQIQPAILANQFDSVRPQEPANQISMADKQTDR